MSATERHTIRAMADLREIDDLTDAGERLSRLLKAARAIGGFSSTADLAAALDRRGLGVSTLRAMERGRRWPTGPELRAIARACGVGSDETFFVMSFSGPDSTPQRIRRVRELRGLTPSNLAALAEVEEPAVREPAPDRVFTAELIEQWEDPHSNPDPPWPMEDADIEILSRALDVPIAVLADEEEYPVMATGQEMLIQELRERVEALSDERDRLVEQGAHDRAMVAQSMEIAASATRALEQRSAVEEESPLGKTLRERLSRSRERVQQQARDEVGRHRDTPPAPSVVDSILARARDRLATLRLNGGYGAEDLAVAERWLSIAERDFIDFHGPAAEPIVRSAIRRLGRQTPRDEDARERQMIENNSLRRMLHMIEAARDARAELERELAQRAGESMPSERTGERTSASGRGQGRHRGAG